MSKFTQLFLLALCLFGAAGMAASEQGKQDSAVTIFTLPPPPPFKEGNIATAKEAPLKGVTKQFAFMEPPPLRACITAEEFNKAAMGSGCSCTCDEYARKPVSSTCDVACQGHYSCWAPAMSDSELDAKLKEMGVASAALASNEKEVIRGVVRMEKGMQYSESRMCKR